MTRKLLTGLAVVASLGGSTALAQIKFELANMANTGFDSVSRCSVAFGDADGDGSLDVFMTGAADRGDNVSNLYLNDGTGKFTLAIGSNFEGLEYSGVAFEDVDADGYVDLLLCGRNVPGMRLSKLYMNNSGNGFTEKTTDVVFKGVDGARMAFADVDGDGIRDVVIAGKDKDNKGSTTLYTNNGSATFQVATSAPFAGVIGGDIAFGDFDGDGSPDLVVTGYGGSNVRLAKLYLNDGSGDFTEKASTPFEGVEESAVAVGDVNGDGFEDIIISGLSDTGKITQLYLNDGKAGFALSTSASFPGVEYAELLLEDIDGDGDLDLYMSGRNDDGRISMVYSNDGKGNFTEYVNADFIGVHYGAAAFGDVDGDGKKDLLITGTSNGGAITQLFLNKSKAQSEPGAVKDVRASMVSIYPNPTHGELNIAFKNTQEAVSIKLVDLSGRTVRTVNAQSVNHLNLDMRCVPGLYTLHITTNEGTTVEKIVIQ